MGNAFGGCWRDESSTDESREVVEAGELERLRLLELDLRSGWLDVQGELRVAIRQDRLRVVRFLVEECGADVNVQDEEGWTALLLAARGGHVKILRFLVHHCGSDENFASKEGLTELMRAAQGGHREVVRFLLSYWGVDVNTPDNNAALMRATSGGHLDVIRFLVEGCSANVNILDKDGFSALMTAAYMGHTDVVRYMMTECGAYLNIQSNNGSTALMLAAHGGRTEIVRFLVEECGADVNIRSVKADTAIRIASDYGHSDIVRILTPFAQPSHQIPHTDHNFLGSDTSRSIEIPPSQVELGEFYEQRNIGGDFRVKWLGADAVVKLFIVDTSGSTFEQEVRSWQELRHPNVLKLYGVCQAAPNVNFFVCEYASQGSLAEYTMLSSSSIHRKPLTWKFLYEAALGLGYLHERGIIHGDLRCSNILIGNDGTAKLSHFGPTGAGRSLVRSMRWQAPEVLQGQRPWRESDVYSLGMCILEAVSGNQPWAAKDAMNIADWKSRWNAIAHASVPYDKYDPENPFGDDCFVRNDDQYLVRRSRELVWQMCCESPRGRSSLASVIRELEHLSIEGRPDVPQPELESATCFEGYMGEATKERWQKLHECMNDNGNAQYCRSFDKLKRVCARLQESIPSQRVLDRFYSLVTDFSRTVQMTPEEVWAMQLSSTRATTTSVISFTRRIEALLKALGESVPEEKEVSWQEQRREQGAAFVSGIADAVLLLQRLKTVEEQAVLLDTLKSEVENPDDSYTEDQRLTMRKTYHEIERKLETEGVKNATTLTPDWFIPWYELILGEVLGAGGFGSVRRAKWLDSDVVVKEVLLPGSDGSASGDSFYDSLYAAVDQTPTDPQTVAKRKEAQEMFRREADIWFGFSHPHVVRLFGACHIGRPFFVCEYATHGTLDSYLRQHPDELWTKLHEAALGVQYLHAREVVHGDLKGNNVVVGSDLKAKVTDFGLSLAVDSEATAPISGAWHWVAPECLVGKKGEQTGVKPTFESDVYSLGMCIVEALRVVEAVQGGKPSSVCLPWGMLDNPVVKHHVARGRMPSRPSICTDDQWNLVTRMCVSDPKKRLRISTVVDELDRFVKTSPGSKTDNQVDHVTDDMIAMTSPVNQESVESMATAARKLLSQLRDKTNQQDNSPVALYDSFWNRIEDVRRQIDVGNHDAACRGAFHFLVVQVKTSTASLETRRGDLISLARIVMGCYALSRRLDKLCDAYFLENPKDLEFPW